MAKSTLLQKAAVIFLLIFVVAMVSRPLRETFSGWCSPYKVKMNACYDQNSGPIYDDRVRKYCEGQVAEGFSTDVGQATVGGVDKGILGILNATNPAVDLGPNYSYVPPGMTGLEDKGIMPFDAENATLAGSRLTDPDRADLLGAELKTSRWDPYQNYE